MLFLNIAEFPTNREWRVPDMNQLSCFECQAERKTDIWWQCYRPVFYWIKHFVQHYFLGEERFFHRFEDDSYASGSRFTEGRRMHRRLFVCPIKGCQLCCIRNRNTSSSVRQWASKIFNMKIVSRDSYRLWIQRIIDADRKNQGSS